VCGVVTKKKKEKSADKGIINETYLFFLTKFQKMVGCIEALLLKKYLKNY
jgi:hypothetical protein